MRSRWQYTPTTDHVEAVPDNGRPLEAPPCSTGQPVVKPPIEKTPDKTKDPRWQQLMALIGQLPPEKAEQLRQMLGSDGLAMAGTEALGQVLKALELRRGDEAPKPADEPLMRRICQLLEPFLVEHDRDVSAGTIRRGSLAPWWAASMAQSPALVELDMQYRRAVAKRLTAEMERLEDEAMAELSRRSHTLLLRHATPSTVEDARRIGAMAPAGRPLIYLSPRGLPLTQARVRTLADGPGAVLLCGRFEGIDQRVLDARQVEEISLGDFVLAGGEIAAMALIEASVRLLPGVLGAAASTDEESFAAGLLEYPHFTRPQSFEGRDVPQVLTSGNHSEIAKWRRAQAEALTRTRRPDLWAAHENAASPFEKNRR